MNKEIGSIYYSEKLNEVILVKCSNEIKSDNFCIDDYEFVMWYSKDSLQDIILTADFQLIGFL